MGTNTNCTTQSGVGTNTNCTSQSGVGTKTTISHHLLTQGSGVVKLPLTYGRVEQVVVVVDGGPLLLQSLHHGSVFGLQPGLQVYPQSTCTQLTSFTFSTLTTSSARTAGTSANHLHTTHIIHSLYLGYIFSQDCRCIRKLPAHNSYHSQSLPWLHLQPGLQVYPQAT